MKHVMLTANNRKLREFRSPNNGGSRAIFYRFCKFHGQPLGLGLWYLLCHTVLCSALLYLLVQSLTQADSTVAIVLFVGANFLFAVLLLSPSLSLRIAWAICAFWLLYLLLQGLSDFVASRTATGQALAALYHILQARMSVVISSAFLLSSLLALRFGKYRSVEAVALFALAFALLTRDALSLSFENRYYLYRLLWLGIPSLNLLLIALSLHPYLRREASWLPPGSMVQYGELRLRRAARARNRVKQVASFAALLSLLFALLWWTRISPINWNRAAGGTGTGNGLLEKNLNNQFDFGEYLKLDSALEQDRQLVMMSQIGDIEEGNHPSYLTRFTLSGLDAKRSFYRDSQEPNMPGESPLPLELERGTSLFEMPRYNLRQDRQMYVFLLNIRPSSLFVLNYPTQVQTFENWPDSSFSRVYRVESRILPSTLLFGQPQGDALVFLGATLEGYAQQLPKDHLAYYTYLPQEFVDIQAFSIALVRQWLGEGANMANLQPLQVARRLTYYFHKNYRYTLNPGIAPNGDQLRYFLFDSQKGYCTYFAFSAGLMLRSLGIPTRVVVGFLLNPELRILNYYPLFADQAHAWLEVFEPQSGWVTFDPTTFELAEGEELEFGLPEGAESDLAALTEELLRNNILNAEDGIKQLVPEKSSVERFLGQLLRTLRQQSWLLPTLSLVLVASWLLAYRARLWYLALRAELQPVGCTHAHQPLDRKLHKVVAAMYHYLQLLCTNLPAKRLPPRQLYVWQNALQSEGQAQTEPTSESLTGSPEQQAASLLLLVQGSLLCLALFQKYYFSRDFGTRDLVSLRSHLKEAARANSGLAARLRTWNLWHLLRSLCRYLTKPRWRQGER